MYALQWRHMGTMASQIIGNCSAILQGDDEILKDEKHLQILQLIYE